MEAVKSGFVRYSRSQLEKEYQDFIGKSEYEGGLRSGFSRFVRFLWFDSVCQGYHLSQVCSHHHQHISGLLLLNLLQTFTTLLACFSPKVGNVYSVLLLKIHPKIPIYAPALHSQLLLPLFTSTLQMGR